MSVTNKIQNNISTTNIQKLDEQRHLTIHLPSHLPSRLRTSPATVTSENILIRSQIINLLFILFIQSKEMARSGNTSTESLVAHTTQNMKVRTLRHVYIRTYLLTYLHTYIHTYTCTHTYIHTYIHTCTHTYIHTH